ncbi:uroporphyrinogen-III C-methyltransferase [Flammeovirga kamogawensis]|uniref:uroporphyrinogen-III C-methyltransferase n=1 Tax=Flammeovirga kamogawensis TaxID=373891 RepID=A0ABX8GVP4_9BACT|nr:uroporphyrinogen-III C-methyltransferase [Flammeovirga kamogawensis]MBB6461678.1 uroporphyrin-III C-methyltransferase [Flammeovirga kamogawensis]QWG07397.1 uroporphyrinogen-III C-methyltransferase [Flammeovirga kamogawensis]TRX69210.1 uroporphyrinogen-III C-methyltransferase [Flammeovirga kamogawensis]
MTPTFHLIGAGPGDAELLTLKALRVLKESKVVLYDALVSQDILNFIPENVEKIYVGKRAGAHYLKQEETNALIVEMAFKYGSVTRLKGGDSFVFGRGQEEIEYTESFGIDSYVVPGISSSLAGPTLAGIPVTKRGINESFWVVTATTCSGGLSKDLTHAAASSATIVVLMGVGKLELIAQLFSMYRNENEPIALVQDASLPTQKVVIGTLKDIVERANDKGVRPPAVIVIGEVVALGKESDIIAASSNSKVSL